MYIALGRNSDNCISSWGSSVRDTLLLVILRIASWRPETIQENWRSDLLQIWTCRWEQLFNRKSPSNYSNWCHIQAQRHIHNYYQPLGSIIWELWLRHRKVAIAIILAAKRHLSKDWQLTYSTWGNSCSTGIGCCEICRVVASGGNRWVRAWWHEPKDKQ